MTEIDNVSIENIKRQIEDPAVKIVSFDIFDTLLVRPCLYSKEILWLLDPCVENLTGGGEFHKVRITTEASISGYYTLDEIYRKIGDENIEIRPYVSNIEAKELELESQLLRPRVLCQKLYEFAIAKNKKIIAASDMYLSSEFLKSVLNSNGYNKISQVYVSNECKASKSDGSLFTYIIKHENVKQSEILHIGDNFNSDFQQPKKKGFLADFLPSNYEVFLYQFKISKIDEKIFFHQNDDKEEIFRHIVFGYALNRIYEKPNIFPEMDLESFSILFVFPVLQSLMFLLQNNKELQAYDSVFFAARDGFLPLNAYRKIDGKLKGRYLYASRRAYKCLNYEDIYEFLLSDEYCKGKTLYEALKIVIPRLEMIDSFPLTESEKSINTNNIVEAKNALAKLEPFISEYYLELRNATYRYYAEQFENKERVLVFDTGYNGSISREFRKKFPKLLIDKIYIWETEKNKKYDEENGTKTICLAKEPYNPYFSYVYELLLSALEGTCTGFEYSKGNIVPIKERQGTSIEMQMDVEKIQSAALETAETFNRLIGDWAADFDSFDVSPNTALARKFLMNSSIQHLFRNITFENKMDDKEKANTLDVLLASNTRAWHCNNKEESRILFIMRYAFVSMKNQGLIKTLQRGSKYIRSKITG